MADRFPGGIPPHIWARLRNGRTSSGATGSQQPMTPPNHGRDRPANPLFDFVELLSTRSDQLHWFGLALVVFQFVVMYWILSSCLQGLERTIDRLTTLGQGEAAIPSTNPNPPNPSPPPSPGLHTSTPRHPGASPPFTFPDNWSRPPRN